MILLFPSPGPSSKDGSHLNHTWVHPSSVSAGRPDFRLIIAFVVLPVLDYPHAEHDPVAKLRVNQKKGRPRKPPENTFSPAAIVSFHISTHWPCL
jgi:hypothetical protein